MDKSLQLIQHLYGEDTDVTPAELLADERSALEFRTLARSKSLMEQRKRVSPNPLVIDHVLKAAHAATLRKGRPHLRLMQFSVTHWAVAASLLLCLVSGLFIAQTLKNQQAVAVAQTLPAWDNSERYEQVYEDMRLLETRVSTQQWGSTGSNYQTVSVIKP